MPALSLQDALEEIKRALPPLEASIERIEAYENNFYPNDYKKVIDQVQELKKRLEQLETWRVQFSHPPLVIVGLVGALKEADEARLIMGSLIKSYSSAKCEALTSSLRKRQELVFCLKRFVSGVCQVVYGNSIALSISATVEGRPTSTPRGQGGKRPSHLKLVWSAGADQPQGEEETKPGQGQSPPGEEDQP